MLFVAKPVETVMTDLFRVILPIVFLGILAVMIAALLTIRYSCRLTEAIGEIEKFLGKVGNGELNEQLAYPVGKRKDEVGELGRHAVDMQRSLRELVEKDALTGLYNRRYGEKRLKQVQKDADSYGMPFCIAIGDIDYFKHVNDTYGHEWGDRVLTQIARIMAERMRREGYAARWGGETCLYHQGLQDAAETLRKLQNEIRDTEFTYNEKEKIRVTMTFGICESSGGNTDELRCADHRLLCRKKGWQRQNHTGIKRA
ncbi:MAG: diguanylate cyclase [Lachnospiraceae bacterium]